MNVTIFLDEGDLDFALSNNESSLRQIICDLQENNKSFFTIKGEVSIENSNYSFDEFEAYMSIAKTK